MQQGPTSSRLSQRQRIGARDFVVSPYSPDSDGVLVPVLPTQCPWHSAAAPCDVRRKSQRLRKTGPRFALTIAKCHRHGAHFTIYPPGYAPYQRVPVLTLSADGAPILGNDDKARSHLEAFDGSVFQAALDARRHQAWARNSDDGVPERWWSTQRRHLDLAVDLTGISKAIDESTRQKISTVLGVPLLLLREESQKPLCGYHDRGSAVSKVLATVHHGSQRAFRLLLAGHLAGRWGHPRSSNPRSRSLEKLPFYVAGTAAPT